MRCFQRGVFIWTCRFRTFVGGVTLQAARKTVTFTSKVKGREILPLNKTSLLRSLRSQSLRLKTKDACFQTIGGAAAYGDWFNWPPMLNHH